MKSPAFQFYPADWLSSLRVSLMTLEEEGAYIRALCYCWKHGSIPSDPDKLARLIGKGGSTTVARVVQAMFEPSADGESLTHRRLGDERQKQADWRKKSANGGKKSAEMRKSSRVVEPPLQGSLPNGANQKATLHLQSSSSSSSKKGGPKAPPSRPTSEEWTTYAKAIGWPEPDALRAFDHYEANGWRQSSGNTIKNWQAAARTCKGRSRPAGVQGSLFPSPAPSVWALREKQKAIIAEITRQEHEGQTFLSKAVAKEGEAHGWSWKPGAKEKIEDLRADLSAIERQIAEISK